MTKQLKCSPRHRVRFIEDDQFEAGAEAWSQTGEIDNALTNHLKTTLVRCVQLEHHRLDVRRLVQLLGDRQNGRRFTGTWGDREVIWISLVLVRIEFQLNQLSQLNFD